MQSEGRLRGHDGGERNQGLVPEGLGLSESIEIHWAIANHSKISDFGYISLEGVSIRVK